MPFVKATWLNSLRAKVLVAYVAGVALSVVLMVLVALGIGAVKGDVLSGPDVADLTENLAEMLRFNADGTPVGLSERGDFAGGEDEFAGWLFESLRQEAAYRVLDAAGHVALSSAAGASFWPPSGPASTLRTGRFEFDREGVAMRGAAAAVEHNGRTWVLQCAVSVRFLQFGYWAFALPFTGAGIGVFSLVLLFVFGACAYVMLRVAFRPLREISEAAAAIAPHSLDSRLDARSAPTEIVPLVDSFNRVLERLERGYRRQQEFLAAAAHELKTPLALIRAQVEVADGGVDRQALLTDVEHMARHVQQLLLLAEASERQNYMFGDVDISTLVAETVAYLRPMADAAGVRVLTPAAAVTWRADRGALFTLLKNMLENAIQHAPRGSDVLVEANASTLSVRDWGPGVTADQLPKLFSRFWRGAHRRDHGAGLGLAICQEIAEAHGWSLSAHVADPGLRTSVSTLNAAGEGNQR